MQCMRADSQNGNISYESSAGKIIIDVKRKRNSPTRCRYEQVKEEDFLLSAFEKENDMHFAAVHLNS